MTRLRLVWLAAFSSSIAFMFCAQAQTQSPAQSATAPAYDVEKLFATSCGWCHQGGGRVQGRGPVLAGSDKTDEFLVNHIKKGKPPGMPAFGKSFSDEQIQAIITYIRKL